MLDRNGSVKVLDMGLARIAAADLSGSDARALEAGLTKVNSIVGTIDYMSPEQAYNSIGADERSDVYSLGCTLFYLLTGSPPFPAGSLVQRLLAHRDEPIPSPPKARKAACRRPWEDARERSAARDFRP